MDEERKTEGRWRTTLPSESQQHHQATAEGTVFHFRGMMARGLEGCRESGLYSIAGYGIRSMWNSSTNMMARSRREHKGQDVLIDSLILSWNKEKDELKK